MWFLPCLLVKEFGAWGVVEASWRPGRKIMKIGILQFFGWRDRTVPLNSVYETALERFSIMDQTGYDAVWLAEHHFSTFSVCPSVHMMGTMAAARTKRLRIGTAVSLAPFYNPLRLAEEVALLDVLSGGRVNWGAGRGFERSEFAAFNIPGEESAARFHETVEIVLKAWTNQRVTHAGRFYNYDGVEVLPKPLQAPHPPVWMAASSMPAIDWAAGQGHSILMDPHSSFTDLIAKRRHYGAKLAEAGYSDSGREIPMSRLVAVDETDEKAHAVAKRVAEWTIESYVGPKHAGNVRGEVRTFGGKDPVQFYLGDVMIHGTAERVADHILSFGAEIGMTYLMAAPMSARSFRLLTDKVLPKVAG
jgi:alkanesulfonate monooxygenase SsuD/methylene tetrahydromethanopterin reductase-like flavin-dependent oxidoreductase (luciferase family)